MNTDTPFPNSRNGNKEELYFYHFTLSMLTKFDDDSIAKYFCSIGQLMGRGDWGQLAPGVSLIG